jgi:beta-lactamase regulating signal transducer with metallopeptidase domain
MALFMAYGIGITALLLIGCHLGEKCLMTFGRPTRVIWLLGLSVAICLPAMGIVGRRSSSTSPNSHQRGELLVGTTTAPVSLAPPSALAPTLLESLSTGLKPFDSALIWFWVTGSVLALFGLALLAIRARRMVALAENALVAGVPILLTDHVGPALVGIFKYDIVVPRWALGLSAEQQSLIVAHEKQHARAFDPLLVWATALAIVAFPWNASLWYLIRRLRTSIELDCDRRVLERAANAHAYASLLVDVGARVSFRPFFAAALSESASQLQRRIRAMSSAGQPLARTRTVASAVATFLVLGAAFRAPRPEAHLFSASQHTEANDARLADNNRDVMLAAKRNFAMVSIESRSRVPVTLLVFTTKSARIVVGSLSVRITSDTLRLRTPTSLTADLTDGEIHLVSVDGSILDVTVVFRDSPATNATAQMPHVILIQGGTGVTGGRAMAPSRVLPEQDSTHAGSEIEPYFEFQVEKPAAQIAGTGFPRYPDALRAAGVEGEVQTQFVVNEDGNIEVGTFKVLRSASFGHQTRGPSVSADDLFASAVRAALPNMRYSPAEVGGKHVRQLVQQSFQFKLDGRPTSGVPAGR